MSERMFLYHVVMLLRITAHAAPHRRMNVANAFRVFLCQFHSELFKCVVCDNFWSLKGFHSYEKRTVGVKGCKTAYMHYAYSALMGFIMLFIIERILKCTDICTPIFFFWYVKETGAIAPTFIEKGSASNEIILHKVKKNKWVWEKFREDYSTPALFQGI